MPSYPDNYEQQYSEGEDPKFIPGNSEEYYSKLDEDVLDLVTSKVGSRPDLAHPKFKKTSNTTATTSTNEDNDTKTESTSTTTESFDTTSEKKDVSKPLIIGISLAIVVILGSVIVFFLRKVTKS
ncbi:SdrH family protein [Mammaliicoccus fleurettii]|nr:SdrH family protein [Mammaliicoccus fleurettii]MEB7780578.1 SdrH family protein [Mammaliicoccus fleurettii]